MTRQAGAHPIAKSRFGCFFISRRSVSTSASKPITEVFCFRHAACHPVIHRLSALARKMESFLCRLPSSLYDACHPPCRLAIQLRATRWFLENKALSTRIEHTSPYSTGIACLCMPSEPITYTRRSLAALSSSQSKHFHQKGCRDGLLARRLNRWTASLASGGTLLAGHHTCPSRRLGQ